MSVSSETVDKHMMDTITIRRGEQDWCVNTAVLASNSGLVAKALRGEVHIPGFADNILCVPVDWDGVAEQTIDLMVDFLQAGGESVAAAFVKKGRVAYQGKIWIDSIERGTDVLQQLRQFFITASVFESPSMESMLKRAVSVNFNKVMAMKGPPGCPDAFDYGFWTYLLTLGLGVAFDPHFVPERLDRIREDIDEVVRAIVEDMVDIVAGPAPKKRKAEDMSVSNSTVDEIEDPDPKRSKKEETIAGDMGVEALISRMSNNDTAPDCVPLTPSFASTDPSADSERLAAANLGMPSLPSISPCGQQPKQQQQQQQQQPSTPTSSSKHTPSANTHSTHDYYSTTLTPEATPDNNTNLLKNPSSNLTTGTSSSPPPSPPPTTTTTSSSSTEGRPVAADATTCAHSASHGQVSPGPSPTLNPHLSALRAALLDALWTHHLDLLSSPLLLRYLSAQPHLSAALFGRFLARCARVRGAVVVVGAPFPLEAEEGEEEEEEEEEKESPTHGSSSSSSISISAATLLNCPEWLAWMMQPGVEDHARAFWAAAAVAQEGSLGYVGSKRRGARLAEGRYRESPF